MSTDVKLLNAIDSLDDSLALLEAASLIVMHEGSHCPTDPILAVLTAAEQKVRRARAKIDTIRAIREAKRRGIDLAAPGGLQ